MLTAASGATPCAFTHDPVQTALVIKPTPTLEVTPPAVSGPLVVEPEAGTLGFITLTYKINNSATARVLWANSKNAPVTCEIYTGYAEPSSEGEKVRRGVSL